jgi:dihydrofolate reductase
MASLTYIAIISLDGYIEDEAGRFDRAEPDEEVHTFVNDLMRDAGTHLYGRRMYETTAVWQTDLSVGSASAAWCTSATERLRDRSK